MDVKKREDGEGLWFWRFPCGDEGYHKQTGSLSVPGKSEPERDDSRDGLERSSCGRVLERSPRG